MCSYCVRLTLVVAGGHHQIVFALHSDSPVTPVNPLMSIHIAAARRTNKGRVLGGEQAIPVERAVRAFTLDAAKFTHDENDKGSLELGKYADFVVLSGTLSVSLLLLLGILLGDARSRAASTDDIFRVPIEQIPNIRVELTVLAGHATHSSGSISIPESLAYWCQPSASL